MDLELVNEILVDILRKGFEVAFDLLNSKQRTACQSILVFITDGRDSDGETVRCGEGI